MRITTTAKIFQAQISCGVFLKRGGFAVIDGRKSCFQSAVRGKPTMADGIGRAGVSRTDTAWQGDKSRGSRISSRRLLVSNPEKMSQQWL